MQQTRALLVVLLVLERREESRGVPLKRALWALHTWIRNCSVGVGPLRRRTQTQCLSSQHFRSTACSVWVRVLRGLLVKKDRQQDDAAAAYEAYNGR